MLQALFVFRVGKNPLADACSIQRAIGQKAVVPECFPYDIQRWFADLGERSGYFVCVDNGDTQTGKNLAGDAFPAANPTCKSDDEQISERQAEIGLGQWFSPEQGDQSPACKIGSKRDWNLATVSGKQD